MRPRNSLRRAKQFTWRRTRFATLAIVCLAFAGAVAGGALAFDSGGTPQAIGPDTITWTGQGAHNGQLDTVQCKGDTPPGTMLWILTTDGGSITNDPPNTPILHLSGTGSGDYSTSNPSENSAAHFITPYFTPDSNLKASADMDVTATGNGSWNLVISHGCPGGGGGGADDLSVSKTADVSFTRTFKWKIDKSADPSTVYSANGGQSGSTKYTIAVTKDGFDDSNWAVSGKITVTNTNDFAVNGVKILDSTPGGNCAPADASLDVPAQGSASTSYTCTFASNPGSGTNTAEADWGDIGSAHQSGTGMADYTFGDPTKVVNDAIDVTDSDGAGPWHFTDSGSVSYSKTFTDPAGTCTDHKNTATITQTGQSDDATVKDCQGVDLQVTKDAKPSFTRTFKWTIKKSASPTSVQLGGNGGQTKVTYTVTVQHDAGTDGSWQVNGKIHVKNPNDWESITLTGLSDLIDNGGNCTVDKSPGLTILASTTVDYPYTCTYLNAPAPAAFTNTATANWDGNAASTPSSSASGSATGSFGNPSKLVDDCVSVSDTLGGSLGTLCVGDANPNPKIYTYTFTFDAPPLGTCADHPNTATFTTDDTGTTGSASASVKICNYRPALTPGYWKNHLANSSSKGPFYSSDCKNVSSYGGSCSTQPVWTIQYLSPAKYLGNFPVGDIVTAAKVFNAMNCGLSTDQSAIGCLAGHLLAAELNLANGSLQAPCVLQAVADANAFLKGQTVNGVSGVNYTGFAWSGTLSAAQRSLAISIKSKLDNYNNGSATC